MSKLTKLRKLTVRVFRWKWNGAGLDEFSDQAALGIASACPLEELTLSNCCCLTAATYSAFAARGTLRKLSLSIDSQSELDTFGTIAADPRRGAILSHGVEICSIPSLQSVAFTIPLTAQAFVPMIGDAIGQYASWSVNESKSFLLCGIKDDAVVNFLKTAQQAEPAARIKVARGYGSSLPLMVSEW